jgi:hypothetical protein
LRWTRGPGLLATAGDTGFREACVGGMTTAFVANAMARGAPPPEVKAIAPAVAAEHRPAISSAARLRAAHDSFELRAATMAAGARVTEVVRHQQSEGRASGGCFTA